MPPQNRQAYKYARIKTDLAVKILEGRLKAHERIPSLNRIAEQYKVSKITARRVLHDLVSDGLVYAVRGKGAFVAEANHRQRRARGAPIEEVGAVFQQASPAFLTDIISGVDAELFSRGGHLSLSLSNDSYEREAELLERFSGQGIRRILLFMVLSPDERRANPNLPLYLRLIEQGVRIVLIDCDLPQTPLPAVCWDNRTAMAKLIDYFHKQGRRRIAYVARSSNSSSAAERFESFKDNLLRLGLSYDAERILKIDGGDWDSFIDNARRGVADMLKRKIAFDSIVCSDESIARGVYQALEEGPARCRRILVGGYGRKGDRLGRNRGYVQLEQDNVELGREAVRILMDREGGVSGSGAGSSAIKKMLPLRLKVPSRSP